MGLIMKNMQEIREKKGMRREDLASKSGMSYAAIRAIEMGIREPLVGNALKIASALNTTIEKLTKQSRSKRKRTRGDKENGTV